MSSPPLWLSYLRLFRITNVFTAVADVAMGFLFVAVTLPDWPWLAFVLAMLASAALYTAGMVLNDAFDAPQDAAERANRPIPQGEISRTAAFVWGFGLLAAGILLAGGAGFGVAEGVSVMRPIGVALALTASVLAYDGGLKRTPLGPLGMGACRFFNVLLGASVLPPAIGETPVWWGFGWPELTVAGGIGLYIVGVTWFARTEARRSARGMLIAALTTMVLGIGLLSAFPYFSSDADRFAANIKTYGPLLFALVGAVVVRRCIDAILRPDPEPVQRAIKQSILSLILFDASVCLVVAPNEPYFGILVLALLGPTILVGRWVAST